MKPLPLLYRVFERLLAPFGFRLIRITPNRVRGVEMYLDLRFLLAGRADPVVFDVGANQGDTVTYFREHFRDATVVAFEPFEECYRGLQQKFGAAGNVRLEKTALGAARETRPMHLYSGHNMNSLLPMNEQSGNILHNTFTKTGTTEVAVETLDHFCQENRFERVDILKIDTQGYDLHVLQGASDLLRARRVRIVLVEVNFIPMYQNQARFSEIHEYFVSHGYRFVGFYDQHHHERALSWCDACYIAPPVEPVTDPAAPAASARQAG